jgi:hypothetical protein
MRSAIVAISIVDAVETSVSRSTFPSRPPKVRSPAIMGARDARKDSAMLELRKKIVVDEAGRPKEVIISRDQFIEISEMLGLDLDEKAIESWELGARSEE